jgi:hypothetical protein
MLVTKTACKWHELKGGTISEYEEISLFFTLFLDNALDLTEMQKEPLAAIEGISAEMAPK